MDLNATAQLLGNFGEFLGSIGVLATLVYLAIQIRQSAAATQLSSSQTAIDRYSAIVSSANKDPQTFAAFKNAINEYASSEPYEQAIFHSHVVAMFLAVRHNEELFAAGALPETTLLDHKKDLARLLKSNGGRAWMDSLGIDPESEPFKGILGIGKDEPPLNLMLPFLTVATSE